MGTIRILQSNCREDFILAASAEEVVIENKVTVNFLYNNGENYSVKVKIDLNGDIVEIGKVIDEHDEAVNGAAKAEVEKKIEEYVEKNKGKISVMFSRFPRIIKGKE